jgi:uncharacterized protein (DUF1697 family)
VTVFVSMLRAVNVGGHGQIKMNALKDAYIALGLGDVRTLLQSGNVVFSSRLKDRAALAKRITQEIERRFDTRVEVVIRTLDEVRTIVQRGPVLSPRADRSKLLVMFLAGVPDAQGAAELMKQHKGPEMIEIRGPEIYLYYPEGVGRSKLSTAFIENKLKAAGTARNWNTLSKLVEAGDAIERV